ncbi:protein DOG1-like 4 [Telopea speciosissima]|uniref:protein DOG1-like 4 n=1 Tax=Telopea speciosissima TaxID=54955 RepID=UPI001CC39C97|nr:protein DOG1-like 4 [Telopea speciosissima]
MSVLPSTAEFMTSAVRNGTPVQENFHKFFECWLAEQNHYLQELLSASKDNNNPNRNEDPARADEEEEKVLRPLINRVVRHYEEYYKAKSIWVEHDVLRMLSPTWRSKLEDAFLWIGGWRPSIAFHLLYSKSGLQLENHLTELFRGLRTGDLADLSPSQLTRIDELQRKTIREEKEVTEKMAKHQETIADSSMVELSHVVTELMNDRDGERSSHGDAEREAERERVNSALKRKEQGLERIVEKANDLRLRTLEGVIEILRPMQAVHFLIAAAELHLRLHDWGLDKDTSNHRAGSGTNHHG